MPDSLTDQYLRIALQLERHVPGYIDAYFGDPVKKARSSSEPLADPADLAQMASELNVRLSAEDLPDDRSDYLSKQLAAMETVARKLAGEEIPYVEEVTRCFDIVPQRIPNAELESARNELDHLLPGEGDVANRMMAWRERSRLDPDRARLAIDLILPETRRRTAAFIELPADESVEIAFVRDKPWRGYNWYLGNRASRVELNIDLPISANQLVDLIAHEAYPGHHTEHCLKGELLYKERGYEEMAIQLINTPECVIHEAIATTAASIIFPGTEEFEWLNTVLYPAIDLDPLPEVAAAIAKQSTFLQVSGSNAALMRHVDAAGEDELVDYLMHFGLYDEQRARNRLRFIDDPLWRPYIFTYDVGRELLRRWFGAVDQTQKESMFRDLLTTQYTPSRLQREAPAA